MCRWCATQGHGTKWALRPRAVLGHGRGGAIRESGGAGPGLEGQARDSLTSAPSTLYMVFSPLSPDPLGLSLLAFSPRTPNWITMSASRPYTRVKVSGVTLLQTAKARAKASSITSCGKSSE